MRARVKGGDKAAEFMKRQKRRMKGKRNVAVGFPSGEVSDKDTGFRKHVFHVRYG